MKPAEVEKLIASLPLDPLEHTAADRLSAALHHTVNAMTEEQYAGWLDYMEAVCRNPRHIGSSLHNLFIARKRL